MGGEIYAFPVYGEAGAVKVSVDCGGERVDPDQRSFDTDITAEERLLVVDGSSARDLAPFTLGRRTLLEPAERAAWLV